MTVKQKKAIQSLEVGSYITDGIGDYVVTNVCSSGVWCECEWTNDFGIFTDSVFVPYEELYDEIWRVIE